MLTAAVRTKVTNTSAVNYLILQTECSRSSVVPTSHMRKLRLRESKKHHEHTACLWGISCLPHGAAQGTNRSEITYATERHNRQSQQESPGEDPNCLHVTSWFTAWDLSARHWDNRTQEVRVPGPMEFKKRSPVCVYWWWHNHFVGEAMICPPPVPMAPGAKPSTRIWPVYRALSKWPWRLQPRPSAGAAEPPAGKPEVTVLILPLRVKRPLRMQSREERPLRQQGPHHSSAHIQPDLTPPLVEQSVTWAGTLCLVVLASF